MSGHGGVVVLRHVRRDRQSVESYSLDRYFQQRYSLETESWDKG